MTADPIRKRIRALEDRKKFEIAVIWDDERAVWLAQATSLYEVFGKDVLGGGYYGPATGCETVAGAYTTRWDEDNTAVFPALAYQGH